MGCVGRLTWINDYSMKHCRSLFWKTRAAMKRAVKNGSNKRLNFQYDPSSYALNFDDGCCKKGEDVMEEVGSCHLLVFMARAQLSLLQWSPGDYTQDCHGC